MTPIPVTICLFTSSQGHFKVRTRYLETLESLAGQIPLSQFVKLIAHIKVSPGDESFASEMRGNLTSRGFRVIETTGD